MKFKGDDDGLKGWDKISAYMSMSRVTASEIIENNDAPVIKIGGTIYSSKKRLGKWLDKYYEENTIYKVRKKRLKAREERLRIKELKFKREEKGED